MRRAAAFFCVFVGFSGVDCGCDVPTTTQKPSLLDGFPQGEEQRAIVCGRGRNNAVTRAFCGDEAPAVDDLIDVQRLLGLSFEPDRRRPDFALTANSAALGSRSVSAINPRAVIVALAEDRDDDDSLGFGFTRGDQLVEFAALNNEGELGFYLLRYAQDCNDDDDGCDFGDLLTPATESGWTRWSLYDDEDLKNTALDCLHCHQPEGLSGQRLFLMQELPNPWTHWIAAFSPGGQALLDDYRDAHGVDEVYAGIPGAILPQSNPILVESLVKRTQSDTVPVFNSPDIEAEVAASSPGQPDDNRTPGTSATWQLLYDDAVAGRIIPPPYHDVKITDPDRLARATNAYVRFQRGALGGPLPDIRDVVDDDALRDLSFRPKAGASGREILTHMCAQCHNARLDPTLTRARFDAVDVERLDHVALQRAADRIRLDASDLQVMPPAGFGTLDDDEKAAAVAFLRSLNDDVD